jgi:hypothetical protein
MNKEIDPFFVQKKLMLKWNTLPLSISVPFVPPDVLT